MVWKSGDLGIEVEVDALRTKVRTWEWDTGAETRKLRERFVYGEALSSPAALHLRGRLYRVYDTAGYLEHTYDFKGNVLSASRKFLDDPEEDVDWSAFDEADEPFDEDRHF